MRIEFEQTWNPFTKRCIVLCLFEIGPVVLEKKIFIFPQCIFAIFISRNYLPLEKGVVDLNPLHLRVLCAKFDWHLFSGSWEEDEMWKVYDNKDDDGQRTNFIRNLAQVS